VARRPLSGKSGRRQLGGCSSKGAAVMAHLTLEEMLDGGNGLGRFRKQLAPAKKSGNHPGHLLAELVLVEKHSLVVPQPPPERFVQVGQCRPRIAMCREGVVGGGNVELLIGVQVVVGRQERHDAGKALGTEPEDLFLAPDPAMIGSKPPGPLAHRKLALEDPGKVAGGDASRPSPLHLRTLLG